MNENEAIVLAVTVICFFVGAAATLWIVNKYDLFEQSTKSFKQKYLELFCYCNSSTHVLDILDHKRGLTMLKLLNTTSGEFNMHIYDNTTNIDIANKIARRLGYKAVWVTQEKEKSFNVNLGKIINGHKIPNRVIVVYLQL